MRIKNLYILGICLSTTVFSVAMESENPNANIGVLVVRTPSEKIAVLLGTEKSFEDHFLRVKESLEAVNRTPHGMETDITTQLSITGRLGSAPVEKRECIVFARSLSLQEHVVAASKCLAEEIPFCEITTDIRYCENSGVIELEDDDEDTTVRTAA